MNNKTGLGPVSYVLSLVLSVVAIDFYFTFWYWHNPDLVAYQKTMEFLCRALTITAYINLTMLRLTNLSLNKCWVLLPLILGLFYNYSPSSHLLIKEGLRMAQMFVTMFIATCPQDLAKFALKRFTS